MQMIAQPIAPSTDPQKRVDPGSSVGGQSSFVSQGGAQTEVSFWKKQKVPGPPQSLASMHGP